MTEREVLLRTYMTEEQQDEMDQEVEALGKMAFAKSNAINCRTLLTRDIALILVANEEVTRLCERKGYYYYDVFESLATYFNDGVWFEDDESPNKPNMKMMWHTMEARSFIEMLDSELEEQGIDVHEYTDRKLNKLSEEPDEEEKEMQRLFDECKKQPFGKLEQDDFTKQDLAEAVSIINRLVLLTDDAHLTTEEIEEQIQSEIYHRLRFFIARRGNVDAVVYLAETIKDAALRLEIRLDDLDE